MSNANEDRAIGGRADNEHAEDDRVEIGHTEAAEWRTSVRRTTEGGWQF